MTNRISGYHAASAFLKGLALAALATAAQAAPPDQAAMFRAFVDAPSYRAILAKDFADKEPAALKATCKTLTLISLDPAEIVEAPEFANGPAGWHTQSGAWVQRATLDKCGTKVLRRMLVETRSDNTLRTRALLPGAFAGGYRLEAAAQAYAVDSMMNVTGCKDWKTGATVVDIAQRSGKPSAGHWSETWTALVCGKTVTARVDYSKKSGKPGDYDIVTSAIAAR